jgi:hypothetical protein
MRDAGIGLTSIAVACVIAGLASFPYTFQLFESRLSAGEAVTYALMFGGFGVAGIGVPLWAVGAHELRLATPGPGAVAPLALTIRF